MVVHEADLPGRQGRRLWVYLTLHRRGPVGRDELAEAIWGDDVPDAWDTALNALASRLRRALTPIAEIAPGLAIRGEPGRYALALPAGSFIDWERARDAIHEADRLVFGAIRAERWPMRAWRWRSPRADASPATRDPGSKDSGRRCERSGCAPASGRSRRNWRVAARTSPRRRRGCCWRSIRYAKRATAG